MQIKIFLGFVCALMLGTVANAATINLQQVTCTTAWDCASVPNDSNASVHIVFTPKNAQIQAFVNGVFYASAPYAAYGQGLTPVNIPMYAANGAAMFATVTFSGHDVIYPCHQAGRVCVFSYTPAVLVSGTLTQ